jgi:hypothetical protein
LPQLKDIFSDIPDLEELKRKLDEIDAAISNGIAYDNAHQTALTKRASHETIRTIVTSKNASVNRALSQSRFAASRMQRVVDLLQPFSTIQEAATIEEEEVPGTEPEVDVTDPPNGLLSRTNSFRNVLSANSTRIFRSLSSKK